MNTLDIARDDINPQGLRALPDDLDPRTYLRQVRTFLGRYADAWEADHKLAGDYPNMANEYLVLVKRLEALEKAGQSMLDATVEGKITVGHQRDLAAALAREEKP